MSAVPGVDPIEESADRRRGEMAISDGETTLSWHDLAALVRAGSRTLVADAGNRRAAVFAPNCIETVVVHLSALRAGVSLVPMNPQLSVDEAAWQLNDSGASIVIAAPETATVALAAATIAGCAMVVAWGDLPDGDFQSWDDWLSRGLISELPSDRRALPFLHYTSGTTGRPKATELRRSCFQGGSRFQASSSTCERVWRQGLPARYCWSDQPIIPGP